MTSSARLVYNSHVIGGRFRLVRCLGEGGMGVVWEAVEARTGQRCALKFIKEVERSPVNEARLLREAQAASATRHPNIVRIDAVAPDDDGTPVIVMELLEGESLGQRLEREGLLSVGQAAAIVQRVASALRAAHGASIVHRDLKPDNVFLVREPNGSVGVRVLDFGIAKQVNLPADSLTVTGTLVGTPLYMSPEQAGGERGLDARSDVWSIAVILFECLTGTTPVTGENYGQLLTRLIRNELTRLSQLRPDLPADLLGVVDGALVPRDRRSTDLARMETVLAAYADREIAPIRVIAPSEPSLFPAGRGASLGETVSVASRPAVTSKAEPQGKGRGAWIALASGLTVLLVVGGAGSYVVRTRARGATLQATTDVAAPRVVVASAVIAEPQAPESEPPIATPPPPTTSPPTPPPASSAPASPGSASAKRPPTAATSAARATTAPPPGSVGPSPKHGVPPEKRLQGGVAGEVPF